MAPVPEVSDSRKVKDALYLLELFCESPQPTTINISGYAEKAQIKPNTIIKRLGEIKKRNKLNIITTTQNPDGYKSSLAVGDAGRAGVKVKKERVTKPTDARAHAYPHAHYNLDHAAAVPNKDKGNAKVSTHNSDPHYGSGTPASVNGDMLFFMPQKRSFEPEADEKTNADANGMSGGEIKKEIGAIENLCKKVKTEESLAI